MMTVVRLLCILYDATVFEGLAKLRVLATHSLACISRSMQHENAIKSEKAFAPNRTYLYHLNVIWVHCPF